MAWGKPKAPGWFGSGERRVGGQVAGSPAYSTAVGVDQGSRGGGRRDEVDDNFANKTKFKVLFVNLAFLLLSVLK